MSFMRTERSMERPSMFNAKQFRAKAAEFGDRIETSSTSNEKREYQQLQRKFAELADNEQWLADNHEQTLHAADKEPPAVTVLAQEAEHKHDRSSNGSTLALVLAGRGENQ
jgi:rubrerythrin